METSDVCNSADGQLQVTARKSFHTEFDRNWHRPFETLDRILNCVAVYLIIAWKVMYLSRLESECPDLSCEIIFESSEWKSVYMTIRQKDPPSTPPTLNEMIRMIASLGGYVIRPSTRPGTQTLWFGLQRVHDLSTAWETFGPD